LAVIATPGGRRLTTCVFDLDDTLYPRAAGVMPAVGVRIRRYMVERLGFDPATVGAAQRDLYTRYGTALRGLQIEGNVDAEDYLAFVHDIDLAQYLQPAPALDAALEGLPLDKAIFTNSNREHAERVLARLGIRRHFDQLVDLRDVDFQCKPSPHAYERLLERLARPPAACLYVEDAPHNLRPAAALGMVTVLVDPLGQACGEFDFCIPSATQITGVVESLCAGQPSHGGGNGHVG
jgi:putative hydrolase of the HAD superfamily